jgi:hypothetical protein
MEIVVRRIVLLSAVVTALTGAPELSAQAPSKPANAWRVPRTPDGRPELQGFWTNITATPLQRPPEFGTRQFLTEEEAAEYERTAIDRVIQSLSAENRIGADLNDIYMDRRRVVEDRRTALIIDPPDGAIPALVPQTQKRPSISSEGPETRTLDERCLLGVAFGSSSASPPMVPNPINLNFYQIIQTPHYIVILSEMIHDARIIRMSGTHVPSAISLWLGDSVGHWEGDTLVVDTTHVSPKARWSTSGGLHVVERFTRTDSNTIRYRFTVEDPNTWPRPWSAEIPFKATDTSIFEYACHEANYTLGNILRGARVEEKAR